MQRKLRRIFSAFFVITTKQGSGPCWAKPHALTLYAHGWAYPCYALMALETVFNKPHPSLLLPLLDINTRKVVVLLLQEVKHDIVVWRAQLQVPRRQEELQPRILAHLISAVKKATAIREYQGVLPYKDALSFLEHITHSVLHPTLYYTTEINDTITLSFSFIFLGLANPCNTKTYTSCSHIPSHPFSCHPPCSWSRNKVQKYKQNIHHTQLTKKDKSTSKVYRILPPANFFLPENL